MSSRKNHPTSIVVLTSPEVAFLTKITNGRPREPEISKEVKRVLHDRLLELAAVGDDAQDRYVFTVSGPEIEQMHLITKSAYSFITESERRARLVLREKMAVASRELGIKLT